MRFIDFKTIVQEAWEDYDASKAIAQVTDISAMVSTNHVYRIDFIDGDMIIGKLSYFGHFDHFKEDHHIINTLANNLLYPFDNVLARSLMKDREVYTYRFQNELLDAWVVFYNPVRVDQKLPRRLNQEHIQSLGKEMARFHLACTRAKKVLPVSSKTLLTDIEHLEAICQSEEGQYEHKAFLPLIDHQIGLFRENLEKVDFFDFDSIPVFVDWNIGNFSLTEEGRLFSRWDYDWFRMSSRVMDFYFMSRVCSDIGDRTVFSYLVDPLMEERFLMFLRAYHEEFPLSANEILFLKEGYRFFLLNYVIKDGNYFFHEIYARKLRAEAYSLYFPSIDKFEPAKIVDALGLS